MKQFIIRNRKNILVQALYSGSIASLFIYMLFRCIFYEFPMSWIEEIMFFFRTILSSCFLFVSATGLPAGLHLLIQNRKLAKEFEGNERDVKLL